MDAAENTWLLDVQGADEFGHYTPQTIPGPVDEQEMFNYALTTSANLNL